MKNSFSCRIVLRRLGLPKFLDLQLSIIVQMHRGIGSPRSIVHMWRVGGTVMASQGYSYSPVTQFIYLSIYNIFLSFICTPLSAVPDEIESWPPNRE